MDCNTQRAEIMYADITICRMPACGIAHGEDQIGLGILQFMGAGVVGVCLDVKAG